MYFLIFFVYSSSIGWFGSRPGFAFARSASVGALPGFGFGFACCAEAGAIRTAMTIKGKSRFARTCLFINNLVTGDVSLRNVPSR